MWDFIKQPWPWYVAGPLIGLVVPALLVLGNKPFGISSTLRHICAACVGSRWEFFRYNWRDELWNLYFVLGILLGAVLAATFLANPIPIDIALATKQDLTLLGITQFEGYMPSEIFAWEQFFTVKGIVFTVIGGFLVGFGTRYGNGCTSGHAITGLSNLQWSSLVATISFMLGGIFTTWVIFPLLFS